MYHAFNFINILFRPILCFSHAFWDMEPIQTSDGHYVARGLIRNMDYDILVCGSSMCENMHVDYIDDLYGQKSIKVVQHGSYSKDLEASLCVAAKANKAQTIIMALDSSLWNKPSDSYRIKDIPQYLTSEMPILYCMPYFLDYQVFFKGIELVKANLNGQVTSMNDWWCFGNDAYYADTVYASYQQMKQSPAEKSEYDGELARDNLSNLEKGIKACMDKGIEINFFIPPYSVANFAFSDYELELRDYKEIWKKLLSYDNVHIYAIQFDTDLISDFDNYRNLSHYSGEVSDIIISDIYYGKYELNVNNIDEKTEQFIKWLDEYNWNELEATVDTLK